MREILFRGKRIDNGEWVEGLPFGSIYGGFFNGAICAIRQTVEKYGDVHDVVLETVGQYTGLTDKNGKRIFEGDIVTYIGEVCLVKWDDETAKFVLENENLVCDFEEVWCNRLKSQIEVIGNIHDNPELLEVKK